MIIRQRTGARCGPRRIWRPLRGGLSGWMGTFDGLLLLVLLEGVVEGGEDVEEEDDELQARPVLLAEGAEGEVVVVHLEGEPGPFDLARLALVLVEVLEGFCLLCCHVVELGESVQLLLDLPRAVHHSSLSPSAASQVAGLLRQASLVPAELIDVHFFLQLVQPK